MTYAKSMTGCKCFCKIPEDVFAVVGALFIEFAESGTVVKLFSLKMPVPKLQNTVEIPFHMSGFEDLFTIRTILRFVFFA